MTHSKFPSGVDWKSIRSICPLELKSADNIGFTTTPLQIFDFFTLQVVHKLLNIWIPIRGILYLFLKYCSTLSLPP